MSVNRYTNLGGYEDINSLNTYDDHIEHDEYVHMDVDDENRIIDRIHDQWLESGENSNDPENVWLMHIITELATLSDHFNRIISYLSNEIADHVLIVASDSLIWQKLIYDITFYMDKRDYVNNLIFMAVYPHLYQDEYVGEMISGLYVEHNFVPVYLMNYLMLYLQ